MLPLNSVQRRDDLMVFGKMRNFPLGGLNNQWNLFFFTFIIYDRQTTNGVKKKNCGCSKKEKSHQTRIRVLIDIIPDLEGFLESPNLIFIFIFLFSTQNTMERQSCVWFLLLLLFLFFYFFAFFTQEATRIVHHDLCLKETKQQRMTRPDQRG